MAAELKSLGAQAEYVRADARHEADVSRLVDRVVERFGQLDVAIKNVGTEGQLGPITEQSIDNFEATFATNVLGTQRRRARQSTSMYELRNGERQGG